MKPSWCSTNVIITAWKYQVIIMVPSGYDLFTSSPQLCYDQIEPSAHHPCTPPLCSKVTRPVDLGHLTSNVNIYSNYTHKSILV